jgi:GxxExxY protein
MSSNRDEIEKLATEIVDIAYNIHKELGAGLFESVYEEVFCIELDKRGIKYHRQKPIDIFYREHRIANAFLCDIMVDEKIIIELKSVEILSRVHFKQIMNYLKLSGIKLGFLINFNEELIKNGMKRIANNL